jgi:arsenite methyltransferase
MDNLTPDQIHNAVASRYSGLACCCTSLSCGAALDVAAPANGDVIVDLGCGRGQDVIRAAGRVGSSGLAIGIDLSEEMLAKARASVPPFLANTRFVRSDLEKLDLADSYADVLISNCTINHAPDKVAVYKEIHRVLKPGGRFVVSDVIANERFPENVRNDPAAWAACYGGAIPEDEYLAAVRGAGFPVVDVVTRSDPYEKGTVMVRSLTIRAFRAN